MRIGRKFAVTALRAKMESPPIAFGGGRLCIDLN
jgi:hypothetical protein